MARPVLYANFVASVDGVVALPGAGDSGSRISGGDEPDRFIMGLLRAAADAVMIGAGTFHFAGGNLWHPEAVYPQAAEGLIDELFLTSSPRLFGRSPDAQRRSLVHGVDLGGRPMALAGVRRHESMLYLRFILGPGRT